MKTNRLVTTAMLIALATILSLIKIFELPFGGSVTPASMMPIILIAYMYGTRWGLFSAFVYSLLSLVTGMGTVSAFFLPGDSQMPVVNAILICLIDYILAYSVLGFGGIFVGKTKNNTLSLALGAILTTFLRFVMHMVSGAIFFGSWAEWFFSDTTGLSQISALEGFCQWVINNVDGVGLSILYSVVYNISYMLPESIITTIVCVCVHKIMTKSRLIK